MNTSSDNNIFIRDLKTIVGSAREYSYRSANLMQVVSNWLIGWRIVEQEQHGKHRAEYGKQIIKQASEALTAEYGKGYSESALKRYRKFYLEYRGLQVDKVLPQQMYNRLSEIRPALLAELKEDKVNNVDPIQSPAMTEYEMCSLPVLSQLSWMHYERLMRVPDLKARMWYMQETASQQWDYRTLKRNIDTQYYYRLMQTPEAQKAEVRQEMLQKTADYERERSAFVKNPMLVEFLGLHQDAAFTESRLEESIINHLQKFLID